MNCQTCKHSQDATRKGYRWCDRLRIYTVYNFYCIYYKGESHDTLD